MRSQAVHKLSPLHHWCSYQEGSIQNVGDHSFIQPLTTSQEALDKLSDRAPVTQLGEEVGDQEGAREPKQKDKTNTFRKRNLLIADNVVNLQTANLQTKIIKLQISIRQPNQVLCICVDFIQSNRLWVNMLIPKADFLIAKSNIKAQVITQKSEREKRISNHGNLLATFRFMRLLSGIFLFEASILRMKKKLKRQDECPWYQTRDKSPWFQPLPPPLLALQASEACPETLLKVSVSVRPVVCLAFSGSTRGFRRL